MYGYPFYFKNQQMTRIPEAVCGEDPGGGGEVAGDDQLQVREHGAQEPAAPALPGKQQHYQLFRLQYKVCCMHWLQSY